MDRGEFVNVGVVLVAPGLKFFNVRMSEDKHGPKRRFGANAFDDVRLSGAPATTNASGATIYLPKVQKFGPQALTEIATRLSRREFPQYPVAV